MSRLLSLLSLLLLQAIPALGQTLVIESPQAGAFSQRDRVAVISVGQPGQRIDLWVND